MADNVQLNTGAGGDVISADDLGTSKVQNVKIGFGVTDTLTKVSAASPLPVSDANGSTAGLALEAGHLATIDAKTPALGQALAAGSLPVVLTAAQIVTLTPPAAITGFALEAGNLALIKAKTDNLDVLLSTRLKPADTLTKVATVDTITNPVTVNAGTNLNTSALALESGGHLASLDTKLPGQGQALAAASLPVVLTAAQITTLTPPAAITNFANETGGNLAALNAKFSALGQNTMVNSQSNVFASDMMVTKITGAAAQTATVNNILPGTSGPNAIDVSNFRSFSVQVVSTGTGGTYSFEGSNDNVNFQAVPVYPQSSSPTAQTVFTASASQFIFYGGCSFTYLRLRIISTITGGSIQAFTALYPWPLSSTIQGIGNGTSGLSIGTLNTIAQLQASVAAADAKANPTAGMWLNAGYNFNGATWDRQYSNWNTVTGDTGAKTANGNSATMTNFNHKGAEITVLLNAVSGTFTTFTFQLQYSFDGGTNWKNLGAPTANDTAPTSSSTYVIFIYPTNWSEAAGSAPAVLSNSNSKTTFLNAVLPRTWRVLWTIAGTTPSATFTNIYVNYQL
jgi:hypothetical protein